MTNDFFGMSFFIPTSLYTTNRIFDNLNDGFLSLFSVHSMNTIFPLQFLILYPYHTRLFRLFCVCEIVKFHLYGGLCKKLCLKLVFFLTSVKLIVLSIVKIFVPGFPFNQVLRYYYYLV